MNMKANECEKEIVLEGENGKAETVPIKLEVKTIDGLLFTPKGSSR